MPEVLPFQNSLSLQDLQKIDKSTLSCLDRHHVRLIAHCLLCFQSMNDDKNSKSLPDQEQCLKWCLSQPELVNDNDFLDLVLEQLRGATKQLNDLASLLKVPPLELTLDDLLNAHSSSRPSNL